MSLNFPDSTPHKEKGMNQVTPSSFGKIDQYKVVETLLRNTPISLLASFQPPIEFLSKNNTATNSNNIPQLHWLNQQSLEQRCSLSDGQLTNVANHLNNKNISQYSSPFIQIGHFDRGFQTSTDSHFNDPSLDSFSDTPIFASKSHLGAVFIPSLLSISDQIILTSLSISNFCRPPNKSNLNSSDLQKRHSLSTNLEKGETVTRKAADNTVEDQKILERLRWVSLGYQYNWTKRSYSLDDYVPFPNILYLLCRFILNAVLDHLSSNLKDPNQGSSDKISLIKAVINTWRVEKATHSELPKNPTVKHTGERLRYQTENEGDWAYEPNTGILNIYKGSDRLRGHKDDVEGENSLPLISISLGQPCLFLLGHESRDNTPTPIVLRSGDVLILGGKARNCYHGVPKLLNFEVGVKRYKRSRKRESCSFELSKAQQIMEQHKITEMTLRRCLVWQLLCLSEEIPPLSLFISKFANIGFTSNKVREEKTESPKADQHHNSSDLFEAFDIQKILDLLLTMQRTRFNLSIRQL